MSAYEDHLLARVRAGLDALAATLAADAYALSFHVSCDEDDARRPMLEASVNTTARVNACTSGKAKLPFGAPHDELEARWNYAFWLQEHGAVCEIGRTRGDRAIARAWIEELGLGFTDAQLDADEETYLARGERIVRKHEDACASVAKILLDDGTVARRFGRPLPIIIHSLEYGSREVQLTKRANPPELIREFSRWVRTLGA